MHINKAIFLDRDGVLIKDVSYPHKIEDLHINNDIITHLKWASNNGFLLIIITNQAGISKGKFTLNQYKIFHEELINKLKSKGVQIVATYYCPYHKDGIVTPFNVDSSDRKPAPGMILKAQEDYNINLKESFMIGDKFSDNINISELRCFILNSCYTLGQKGTYKHIDDIFKEIKNGKQ